MVDPLKLLVTIKGKGKSCHQRCRVQAPIWLQLNTKMLCGVVVDVKNIVNPTTKNSKQL
jgi:hypothetical protein